MLSNKYLGDYLLQLEIYNFAMRLRGMNMGCRRIRRAIIEAYNKDVPERTISGWISGRHHPLGNTVRFRKCPELGYVAGGWFGDGSKIYRYNNGHRQYRLTLRVVDYDFAEAWGRAAAIATGKAQPYKPLPIKEDYSKKFGHKPRWQVAFCNVLLFQILDKNDPWKAYELLELYSYPEATLSGFFDADGWASKKAYVYAENTNYDLLLMMQELAGTINIHSKVYAKKNKGGRRQKYILVIYKKDSVINFYRKVGFKIRRKQAKLINLMRERKWI